MSGQRVWRVAAGLLLTLVWCGTAGAQKSGGILRIYHRDSPASMSIHEEGTNSVAIPTMAVFNNLVLYDQHQAQNSLDTIVPDLAESWSWNEEGTRLSFKLHQGVKWHDGKPFTSADVKCTWDQMHLGSLDRPRRREAAPQPAQIVVEQRRGNRHRGPDRGHLCAEASAAGDPGADRLGLHAGLSL